MIKKFLIFFILLSIVNFSFGQQCQVYIDASSNITTVPCGDAINTACQTLYDAIQSCSALSTTQSMEFYFASGTYFVDFQISIYNQTININGNQNQNDTLQTIITFTNQEIPAIVINESSHTSTNQDVTQFTMQNVVIQDLNNSFIDAQISLSTVQITISWSTFNQINIFDEETYLFNINSQNQSTIQFNQCIFQNINYNITDSEDHSQGLIIQSSNTQVDFESTTFTNIIGNATLIYSNTGSSTTINQCTFNNSTFYQAIYVVNNNQFLKLSNNTFQNLNLFDQKGNAHYLINSNGTGSYSYYNNFNGNNGFGILSVVERVSLGSIQPLNQFSGNNIKNSKAMDMFFIANSYCEIYIDNNLFTNNNSPFYYIFTQGANLQFENNILTSNEGAFIIISASSHAQINNNTLTSNLSPLFIQCQNSFFSMDNTTLSVVCDGCSLNNMEGCDSGTASPKITTNTSYGPGKIIGIIFGIFVAIAIIIAIVLCIRKRQKHHHHYHEIKH